MGELRIPLAQRLTTRDGTLLKDSLMSNLYREGEEGRLEAVKRPGLTAYRGYSGNAQGMFNLSGAAYTILSDTIRGIDSGSSFAIPSPGAGTAFYDSVTNVTFGAATIAVIKSLSGLWTFDGATVTKITDPDYPAVTARGLVLIDGTFYVTTPNGSIQGSDLEDPTS